MRLEEHTKSRKGQVKTKKGLEPMSFDNFNQNVAGVKPSFKAAKQFAEGEGDFVWLLLYGSTGCGKTHLLEAIYRYTINERKLDARFFNWPDLISTMRAKLDDHTIDEFEAMVKDCFVLIIDEFGLDVGSEWEKAKFEEIMSHRFDTFRPTVVATNLSLEQIPERIRSRFQDRSVSMVAHNNAEDYRLKKVL
jgi:DNA replication protein DnaC